MPRGKLIAEIYETQENSTHVPHFEYILCDLSDCFKRGDSATLKDIIESGFDSIARKEVDEEARRDVLEKLEDAHLDMINVIYSYGANGNEPSIKLSNVIPISMGYADARRAKRKMDSIILFGRYKFSNENTSTVLKDAQRLSLIYSTYEEASVYDTANSYDDEEKKEISLNLTFFEE